MDRLSSFQINILLAGLLSTSIAANAVLYLHHSKQAEELSHSQTQLASTTALLQAQEEANRQHKQQLTNVNQQQTEFGEAVQALHEEVMNLQQKHVQMTEAEAHLQQRLDTAKSNLQKNTNMLSETRAELLSTQGTLHEKQQALEAAQEIINKQQQAQVEAKATIKNQQRALAKTFEQAGEPSDSAQQVMSQLIETFLEEPNIHILQSQNTVRLDMPLDAMFRPTEAALDITAILWLQPLAAVLAKYPDTQIQVVGHTDARPIQFTLSDRYPTHWELTTARASRVVSELIKYGIASERLTASGRASNAPLRLSQNEDAWRANRRLEIIIR